MYNTVVLKPVLNQGLRVYVPEVHSGLQPHHLRAASLIPASYSSYCLCFLFPAMQQWCSVISACECLHMQLISLHESANHKTLVHVLLWSYTDIIDHNQS